MSTVHNLLAVEPSEPAEKQSSNGWQVIQRERGGYDERFKPLVTIRSGGIALSRDFVSLSGVDNCSRVTVMMDIDKFKLGLRFHSNDADEHSYKLGRDGGPSHGKYKGRTIHITAIFNNPSIAALMKMDATKRKFKPQKDIDGIWTINFGPCFEHSAARGAGTISSNVTGIYRYLKNGEVVYIGRGRIKDRAAEKGRQNWMFDQIEYSILNDINEETKWEAYWITSHTTQFNGLPFYNQIGGATNQPKGTKGP